MIDWNLALATATKLSRPGPDLSAAEAAEAVAELREGAARSEGPVREFSDLHARSATAPVLVIDRPRWVEANLSTFELLMNPVEARLAAAGKGSSRLGGSISRKVSGAEVGALMSFMSSKVLGQFDPFWTGPDGEGGRLLLVAPNVVEVERKLGVDPHDFRLWVCLHEETHRVQFTAVDWMRGHMTSLIDEFIEATDLDSSAVASMMSDGLGEVVRIVKGDSDASLSEVFQNDRQREIVDRLTGIMSLLEGHADVVMDGVGPEVIPSVAEIRRKFTERRAGASPLDRMLRRLLGVDAKMRQYRDGATFVRHVIDTVGLDGFNQVWAGPDQLPGKAEILDPAAWITRVHG
ncbi:MULTISPECIES: zinc-dependent metalloprotease [Aeromicrobium]|uniref:zinc-dependent metalloprotease n=1 Tax=Aeromicrobium TaxID=2040 RepID=UPI0006FFDF34|nr:MULTISPECIES: zinc-dependent metalloprotease [Aeromicrobium]KQX74628.1 coenzyme F420 biosynthesis-associated protein [Aeromicrobium sp. Root472D3]MCL8251592.1 zinc-dependent metalloprotease [Aeromicrobium fastidiosum]